MGARLALGIGFRLAGDLGGPLGGAPGFASLRLQACGGAQIGVPQREHVARLFHRFAGEVRFQLQVCKPVALGEAPRGGGRGIGRGDHAVPAPEVARLGDEALAWLQLRLQARPVRRLDDADLAEAPQQGRGAGYLVRQRARAGRQRRIASLRLRARPAGGGGGVHGQIEVVPEGGAQRHLIALGDGEKVRHGRKGAA